MSTKKEKNCSTSIGIYDKCNNLVNYVEFSNQDLKCYYGVEGNVLNKKLTQNYIRENPVYVSSVIEHQDNIMLYPLHIDGETSMQTIKSGQTFTSFNTVSVCSRVDTYLEDNLDNVEVQHFSLKADLVDEWLNKL